MQHFRAFPVIAQKARKPVQKLSYTARSDRRRKSNDGGRRIAQLRDVSLSLKSLLSKLAGIED